LENANCKLQIAKCKLSDRQSSAPGSSSSPQSPIPNPFVIHTPTATVTDLGTEFGVEVDAQGTTTSHVFRGSIQFQATATTADATADVRVLQENQTARVRKQSGESGGARIEMLQPTAKIADVFARAIPKTTIKAFDLVDVVAGGDGFSGNRGRGIDPRSGEVVVDPASVPLGPPYIISDRQYHRVKELPFVDGVFIPDGNAGKVQVSSAGHVVDNFYTTKHADAVTAGCVWAGGVYPVVGATLGGIDYAAPGHGVLYLHANKGVTFDLAAIRHANRGCKLLRFRAAGGNTETANNPNAASSADLLVLVDGKVRFRRWQVNSYSGPLSITVSLGEDDRFLTLAATDGGNGICWDWMMFGDPRLEIVAENQPSQTAVGEKGESDKH
jgi:hypothetical protein